MSKEKLYRLLFIIESIIVSIVLLIFIAMLLLNNKTETLITENTNDTNTYKVSIYKVGTSFMFSKSEIKVSYSSTSGKETSFTTDIANDGGDINESNYDITWKDDIAILTLKGGEQSNVTYLLSFTKENQDESN